MTTGIVIQQSLIAYDFTCGPSGTVDYVKAGCFNMLLNWKNYYLAMLLGNNPGVWLCDCIDPLRFWWHSGCGSGWEAG